ncbi:MAG: SMC family ATPase, partial [Clostridia bacterium]|nr:SMC family ATPase [Clostridia bacterium]
MKPVRLEFQGFNSFSEKAEIDFTALLSGGVFGIFGKTGSGKSTILDCIMYALFAKTSRSQTIAEYVNDKCRSAYVDFTFEILSRGERKTYNVKRTIKLNKQNKPDTSVVLSVAENGFVRPIAEGEENAKIREIIGIGYEEFSKCIILPQNEFAVFVKSTRRDRLLLVSKLFSLQKYDKLLTEATKKRKAEEMLLLSGIDGELNQLSEYTEEYLEQLKAAFIAQKTQLSEYNIKLKEAEEKVGEMQYYYGVSKQAAQNASVLEDLNEKRPRIEELKRKAAAGTLASVIAREFAALTEKENRLKKARAERDKYLSLKLSAEREAAVTDEKLSGNISGEISSLSETIGIMRANSSVAEEIDSLRLAFASATAEHDKCNIENERLTREIRRLSEQIAAFGNPSEKFEKLLLEVGATAAGRELSDELNYFRSKRSAAEMWAGERIYGELVKEIDLRIAYVSEKIAALSAGETDADDLIERLTEIRAAGSKIEELNGLLSEKRA